MKESIGSFEASKCARNSKEGPSSASTFPGQRVAMNVKQKNTRFLGMAFLPVGSVIPDFLKFTVIGFPKVFRQAVSYLALAVGLSLAK
jgi:hypothetical protein